MLHDTLHLPERSFNHINPGAVHKELEDAETKMKELEGKDFTASHRAIITHKHARSAACAVREGGVKVRVSH